MDLIKFVDKDEILCLECDEEMTGLENGIVCEKCGLFACYCYNCDIHSVNLIMWGVSINNNGYKKLKCINFEDINNNFIKLIKRVYSTIDHKIYNSPYILKGKNSGYKYCSDDTFWISKCGGCQEYIITYCD